MTGDTHLQAALIEQIGAAKQLTTRTADTARTLIAQVKEPMTALSERGEPSDYNSRLVNVASYIIGCLDVVNTECGIAAATAATAATAED